ncbi:MAG TPA: hypothetical protein VGC10_03510 [Sphingomonas sp.]
MTPIRQHSSASNAALGGAGVIFVTGAFAIIATGAVLLLAGSYGFRMAPVDWVLLGFVLVLTVGGGIAMARFIRLHGGEIGETRFDTSHPDDPPG